LATFKLLAEETIKSTRFNLSLPEDLWAEYNYFGVWHLFGGPETGALNNTYI
jgi:hypothetical protein